MANLINIVSHLPMPVRLFEPYPDPEKPGSAPNLRSVVISGKSHPDGSPVVTRGVDDDIFSAWKGANEKHPWLESKMISVVSDEDADKMADHKASFGFEPGLKALDLTGADKASLEGEKDHSEVDMNAYSKVPNEDSPRSQNNGAGLVAPTPQPVDPEPKASKSAPQMTEAELDHATRPEPVKA